MISDPGSLNQPAAFFLLPGLAAGAGSLGCCHWSLWLDWCGHPGITYIGPCVLFAFTS